MISTLICFSNSCHHCILLDPFDKIKKKEKDMGEEFLEKVPYGDSLLTRLRLDGGGFTNFVFLISPCLPLIIKDIYEKIINSQS